MTSKEFLYVVDNLSKLTFGELLCIVDKASRLLFMRHSIFCDESVEKLKKSCSPQLANSGETTRCTNVCGKGGGKPPNNHRDNIKESE